VKPVRGSANSGISNSRRAIAAWPQLARGAALGGRSDGGLTATCPKKRLISIELP
jgi:hypothetical protein